MIMQVFSVYDQAVQSHLPPFFCRAKGEALRSFSDAVNDKSHQFSKHYMDYVLVYLGEWNDNSGLFICREPVRIISAKECMSEPDFNDEDRVEGVAKANGRLPM